MDESLLLSFAEAEKVHWWFTVRRRIVLDEIARQGLSDTGSVLDVGCGTGGTLDALRREYPESLLSGIEPVRAAAECAAVAECRVTQGVFEELPFPDGSMDTVTALDVLEHCEVDTLALTEAHRVLKPGGFVLLTVPAMPSAWSSHDTINGHYRRYTARTLEAALGESGFEIERMTHFNLLLMPLAITVRKLADLAGSKESPGTRVPAAPLNSVLRAIFSLEARFLRSRDIFQGLSLLAVGRKV